MPPSGKRWTVTDRYGNTIYLTEERWAHIIAAENHPEMVDFEMLLQETIVRGTRRQEPLNPRKYRYVRYFSQLPEAMNHVVAIVVFGFEVDVQGRSHPNNYVATAFLKHIRPKG